MILPCLYKIIISNENDNIEKNTNINKNDDDKIVNNMNENNDSNL